MEEVKKLVEVFSNLFVVKHRWYSLEMSDWLEQPKEGDVKSDVRSKGKERGDNEQNKLLESIEAESSQIEVELKGLMRQYALMLFQKGEKKELQKVEKRQKELNARLGELRRAKDLWLEADKEEVTVVESNEDRSGGVDLLDPKVSPILPMLEKESELKRALQLVQAVTASQSMFHNLSGMSSSSSSSSSSPSGGGQSSPFRGRQKVKEVPSLKEDRVNKAVQVIKFIHQFKMVMKAHAVSERDQKTYLLEVIHKSVAERLLVEGIELSSIGKLLSLVKRSLLGPHWERKVSDKWQTVRMVENESIFRFRQRVQMFNRALGRDPEMDEGMRTLIYSELRFKIPVVMREMVEEENPLYRCLKEWGKFWDDLEVLEHSLAFKDRVLMHRQLESQGGLGESKSGKKKFSQSKETPKSGGSGGAGGSGGSGGSGGAGGSGGSGGAGGAGSGSGKEAMGRRNRCFRCGSDKHWLNECDHPIASKIPLKADGRLPIICYNCFEAGHSRMKCPKKKPPAGNNQPGGRALFAGEGSLLEDRDWAEEREIREPFLDRDFLLGEVAMDFRLGEPKGAFPVLDVKREGGASGSRDLKLGDLKVQREEDLRKGGREDMQYPFLVGDLDILGILDSGADYLLVDPEIWRQMEGEVVKEPIGYLGVSGSCQTIELAKLVIFRVEDGLTSWLAYPLPNQKLGIKALVPWDLAKELGAELSGLPKFFANQVHRSDDTQWVRGEGVFKEKMLPEEVRVRILKGIEKELGNNELLPANSKCSLEGAEYRIEILKDAQPSFKPQYPLCERFLAQVKERVGEWLEKGWVKLLLADRKPDWHSPLLAVKKILGNKWNGNICLCVDFRGVNAVTGEPSYSVPLCREMLGRLEGTKVFTELDLVDAYHQIALEEGSKEFTTFTIPGKGKACWQVLFLGLKVVEELRFIAGFQKRNIMRYNPRQNSLVERFVAETKRLLFKWLKGDVLGWEGYVPVVQMSLNDRILLRHNSQPFSLMFGRRLNSFEAYRDGEFSDNLSEEERAKLLKEVKDWGEDIWSVISKESEKVGGAHASRGNKRERSKTRVEGFKEGDLVLKKVLNRRGKMGECWEGPFEVLGQDMEQGGFKLKELDGRFLNFLVPADQLRRVEQVAEEEEVSWEVDKILEHRGEEGQRFYKVKWKGRFEPSWEPAEMFDTTECIRDYWDGKKRGGKKGGKGKGRASSSSSSSFWGIFSETNKWFLGGE